MTVIFSSVVCGGVNLLFKVKNLFCQHTTVSRNYDTHYDQKSKNKALVGKELSEITRQLRGVLLSAILSDLGLVDEQFEEGL